MWKSINLTQVVTPKQLMLLFSKRLKKSLTDLVEFRTSTLVCKSSIAHPPPHPTSIQTWSFSYWSRNRIFSNLQQKDFQHCLIQSVYISQRCFPGSNLLQHIFSGIYLVACYAISIYMLKLTYFIGNLDKFLLGITDIQTGTTMIKHFDWKYLFYYLKIHLRGALWSRLSWAHFSWNKNKMMKFEICFEMFEKMF